MLPFEANRPATAHSNGDRMLQQGQCGSLNLSKHFHGPGQSLLQLHQLTIVGLTLVEIELVRSRRTPLSVLHRTSRIVTDFWSHDSGEAKSALLSLLMATVRAFPNGSSDFDLRFRSRCDDSRDTNELGDLIALKSA